MKTIVKFFSIILISMFANLSFSQALIKAVNYKGLYPYWWKVTSFTPMINNKTIVTLNLYANQKMLQENTENYFKEFTTQVTIEGQITTFDSLYIKVKQASSFFSNAVYTDGSPVEIVTSNISQEISSYVTDTITYNRVALCRSFFHNLETKSITLDLQIDYYVSDTINQTYQVLWVVDNFYKIPPENTIGEYDYFIAAQTSNGWSDAETIKQGILYGDANGSINSKIVK